MPNTVLLRWVLASLTVLALVLLVALPIRPSVAVETIRIGPVEAYGAAPSMAAPARDLDPWTLEFLKAAWARDQDDAVRQPAAVEPH